MAYKAEVHGKNKLLSGRVIRFLQAAVASGAATPDLQTEENSPSASDREDNGANGHANGDTGERSCTGILTSHPQSRDIQFEKFTLLFHGHMLLEDTNLELNYGRLADLD